MVARPPETNGTNGHSDTGWGALPAISGDLEMVPVRRGADEGLNRAFSGIIAAQEASTRKLLGFLKTGNIKEDEYEKRQLVEELLELFLEDWNADICNLDGLYVKAEANAAKWTRKISKEEDRAAAEEVLQKWNGASAWQLQVRIRERRHGLAAVEQYRREWAEMEQSKTDAEFDAGQLPPAAYQYFGFSVEQYAILEEIRWLQATGCPRRDYTEVKAKLAKGDDVDAVIGDLPWQYQVAYLLVQGSLLDGSTFWQSLMAMFAQQLPWDMQPPAPRKRGILGFSGKDDDEEDEEDDTRGARARAAAAAKTSRRKRRRGRNDD